MGGMYRVDVPKIENTYIMTLPQTKHRPHLHEGTPRQVEEPRHVIQSNLPNQRPAW